MRLATDRDRPQWEALFSEYRVSQTPGFQQITQDLLEFQGWKEVATGLRLKKLKMQPTVPEGDLADYVDYAMTCGHYFWKFARVFHVLLLKTQNHYNIL